MSFQDLIASKKLIVCCGSGGVGKTTLSAALALKACQIHSKVVVLTIDPARRLANSLGVSRLGDEEREIDISSLAHSKSDPPGRLFALMLDTKRTFDKIIERYAPNAEARESIFKNPLYQHLSNMIAGSQEYMAMEKVYELYQKNEYDLIILDTPPTQHALDFLEAPQKMVNAVTDSMLKWLLKPSLFLGKTSLKLLGKGAGKIFKTFSHVVGMEFLEDLSVMILSTAGLLEGFKDRAQEVQTLLRNSNTTFLLVSAPRALVLKEALYFYERIQEFGLPFGGFLINQVYQTQAGDLSQSRLGEVMEGLNLSDDEQQGLLQIYKSYHSLVSQDQKQLRLLKDKVGKKEMLVLVPRLESDVHNLRGLCDLGTYL